VRAKDNLSTHSSNMRSSCRLSSTLCEAQGLHLTRCNSSTLGSTASGRLRQRCPRSHPRSRGDTPRSRSLSRSLSRCRRWRTRLGFSQSLRRHPEGSRPRSCSCSVDQIHTVPAAGAVACVEAAGSPRPPSGLVRPLGEVQAAEGPGQVLVVQAGGMTRLRPCRRRPLPGLGEPLLRSIDSSGRSLPRRQGPFQGTPLRPPRHRPCRPVALGIRRRCSRSVMLKRYSSSISWRFIRDTWSSSSSGLLTQPLPAVLAAMGEGAGEWAGHPHWTLHLTGSRPRRTLPPHSPPIPNLCRIPSSTAGLRSPLRCTSA